MALPWGRGVGWSSRSCECAADAIVLGDAQHPGPGVATVMSAGWHRLPTRWTPTAPPVPASAGRTTGSRNSSRSGMPSELRFASRPTSQAPRGGALDEADPGQGEAALVVRRAARLAVQLQPEVGQDVGHAAPARRAAVRRVGGQELLQLGGASAAAGEVGQHGRTDDPVTLDAQPERLVVPGQRGPSAEPSRPCPRARASSVRRPPCSCSASSFAAQPRWCRPRDGAGPSNGTTQGTLRRSGRPLLVPGSGGQCSS